MDKMKVYRSLPNDLLAAMEIVWEWRGSIKNLQTGFIWMIQFLLVYTIFFYLEQVFFALPFCGFWNKLVFRG